MKKTRFPSVGRQVQLMLYQHKGIGLSKLESRNESGLISESGHKVSNLIHSIKSLENMRNDLTNLGKFAKSEFEIKDMSKIDAHVIKSWIESKGISYNTASNYLSELNKMSDHLSISREEVKDLRTELKQELRPNELQSRAYKGLDKIQLPAKSQPAFELQRDYGLRVSAATKIDIDFQIDGNRLLYQEKGGMWTEREISHSLILKIRENAVNGKYELPTTTYRNHLRKEIEHTGQKYNGSHGIRHSYAQNRLMEGYNKEDVSKMLGHSREEITNTYIR